MVAPENGRRVPGLRIAEVVGLIEICMPGLLIERVFEGRLTHRTA
jgi:hypothetical protein